ncbi:MAG TPA: CehA/McbA family metallohydrolase [Pirellulales bacterium]|nr:CehA/McbA family metallohydrolase [Pirellulales bacterium]
MSIRRWSPVFAWLVLPGAVLSAADLPEKDSPTLPIVQQVELQPLKAQIKRLVQTLESLGNPLDEKQRAALDAAYADTGPSSSTDIQKVLDPLCLVGVNINPESRVKVLAGPAAKELVQRGWRLFLVKVYNEARVPATLRVTSPNAAPQVVRSSGKPDAANSISPAELADRWLDVAMFGDSLSGLGLEYRILELYSRDVGQREAKLAFDVGQGTQDVGFRNEVDLLFDCRPAVQVTLDVLDEDGRPTIGQFVFRDGRGRIYPSLARRLAPDFFFHEQIYRADGETVSLPPGRYEVTYTRGPEYRVLTREITVPNAPEHRERFRLERWIRLADLGWYSGDHHVHGAGCSHYEAPTEGVTPADMIRHIVGEDLNVGCVLSWGPCWYHQKQFFEADVSKLSTPRNLMRYDVEVSGFPSSHCGHLCLLRLKKDDYPGTTKIEEWPSWDLPILRWGKEQGGVVGFSHSGWGLQVSSKTLPTYEMPKFDGIGANEYIVDVVHGVCDFISAVDTPIVWELSIWYHTLNCGYTARISGETDFPCIYDDRVGLGRSYVKLDTLPDRPLDYDDWVNGIRAGRSYVGDGLSHLVDFRVGDGERALGVGEPGEGGRTSVWAAKKGDRLKVTARTAAWLDPTPNGNVRSRALDQKPYWHLERARIGDSRRVPVELIVNGQSVEKDEIEADGTLRDVEFDYQPSGSCWIALRIFASSHTNPVFVELDGAPIRASKKSAQWCLDAVDVCWNKKSPGIREGAEREAARQAFDAARDAYRKILAECTSD